MGPRRQVNNKTAWWGQENAADNKMAIGEITARGTGAGGAARTNVLEEVNPKMGARLGCSPKGGQASGAFTQINNMKSRGTESNPIADEYCETLKMRAKCSVKIVQRMNSTQNGMQINI